MKADAVFEAIEATWPAAAQVRRGPWMLRDGLGGGKRVSAARPVGAVTPDDVDLAEADMLARAERPLFMLRPCDADLDDMLAARGYDLIDPTNLYSVNISKLTDIPLPHVTAFCIWEPLAIMEEIWAKGGIGPARLGVMSRVETKTGIFVRCNDKPAGAAFAGIHQGICMVHAVEVLAHQRRQGAAQWIMRAGAFWAQKHGATQVTVLCTQANVPANRLYSSLGFNVVGDYHYRQKTG